MYYDKFVFSPSIKANFFRVISKSWQVISKMFIAKVTSRFSSESMYNITLGTEHRKLQYRIHLVLFINRPPRQNNEK